MNGKVLGEVDIVNTTKALVELGSLAMAFGRINRTCVVHPTGEPESDTDHTVMLAWIAPPLAELINKRAGYEKYPVGKVTEYAVVHDAVEVYAGDTPTHRITAAELAEKAHREYDASVQLYDQFIRYMPWFARTVRRYEEQADSTARFVRSVDKIMPKIVHVINASTDLVRAGLNYDDFVALYRRQREQIQGWCPEPVLLQIYDEFCAEVGRQYPEAVAKSFFGKHTVVVEGGAAALVHECEDRACPVFELFDKWIAWNTLPLNDGEYPVDIDADGSLVFSGKQD